MKPDSYIPFHALEFWQAVDGHPDFVATAFARAITYYWFHTHCEGLKDDQEFLRRLCRVETHNWEIAQAAIFDNRLFTQDHSTGLWHQDRYREEWARVEASYTRKIMQTRNATAARLAKMKGKVK